MKETKNKKGFTLVELLAVIAILAILVIMALPAVLRMYRQSRINNFQNEVRSTFRTAQSQFLGDSINLESGEKILYTNADSCTPTGVDSVKELDMTGNSNFKYYVLINVDGKVLNVRASNGTYSYSIQAEDADHDIKIEDIDVETNNESTLDTNINSTLCPSEEETYVPHIATVKSGQTCSKTDVGCELIVGGENFYVVSSDSTNTILLAKYDLKSDGSGSYTQDTSGTNTNIVKVMFLDNNNTAYWDNYKYVWNGSSWSANSTGGLISPYSDGGKAYCTSESGTNCAYVYDENAENIESVVTSYANKIGTAAGTTVEGKLMSLEEAYTFKNSGTAGSNAVKDKNSTYYWLGSARSQNNMWYVRSDGSISNNVAYSTYGVRPVIIVSTSAI